ncbi:hypothetical protein [Methanococcoides sp. NM1]|uniref:hypothetical protein n=1 Tax=Methanococcoides sp. NM1 TaxID=1201013 RepID=UPI0010839BE7|nr:hypothetical protein [Methanococcoides sp. NM1]
MDRISENKLVVGVVAVLVILAYCYYIGQLLSGVLIALLVCVILLVPVREFGGPKASKKAHVQEEFEGEVLGDSRVSEKAKFFIGIPLGLVFGKIFSRYESIFTVRGENRTVVVVYPGICPVSKDDKVRVFGTWYEGENVGIKGNFVRASRVLDESSGLVFVLKDQLTKEKMSE